LLYRAPVATFPKYTSVQQGCEIHWGLRDQWNALFGKRWEVIPFKEAKGHLKRASTSDK